MHGSGKGIRTLATGVTTLGAAFTLFPEWSAFVDTLDLGEATVLQRSVKRVVAKLPRRCASAHGDDLAIGHLDYSGEAIEWLGDLDRGRRDGRLGWAPCQ